MVHAQAAHMVNIYEIGESDEEDDSSTNIKSNKLDKTNGESYNNINGSSCNGAVAMHSNENVSRFPFAQLFMHLNKKKLVMWKNFYGWRNNKNLLNDKDQSKRKILLREWMQTEKNLRFKR